MKKSGIMNAQLSRILSEMGHGDLLVIADMGLPIPKNVERVDLCLKCGTPSFKEVLEAIVLELQIEKSYLANDIKEKNPETLKTISLLIDKQEFIANEKLKELSKNARAIVRTGECSLYANIILVSGVTF